MRVGITLYFAYTLSPAWLVFLEQDEILHDDVREVVVDDPVHELEAAEGDWEEDAAVLVDVGCCDAEHGVDVARREEGDGGRRQGGYGRLLHPFAAVRSET